MLTIEQIKTIFPRAPDAHVKEFYKQHVELFEKYVRNIPFFLAQIGHESAGLSRFIENMNYSDQGLLRTWPSRFNQTTAAEYARQPERIANRVYSNRMGNGNEASGDGWRYRGHGYIQLTGKDAYRTVGNIIGLDLVSDPTLTINPKHALKVVCGVWEWKKLNNHDDFIRVTRLINGGTHGLADRQRWLKIASNTIDSRPVSNIKIRDNRLPVDQVQRMLNTVGYNSGPIDGVKGPMTRNAIKRFKRDNDIGNDTLIDDILFTQLEFQTNQVLVRQIQYELSKRNVAVGSVDGIIGPMTRNGIKTFKMNNDMSPGPDICIDLLNLLEIPV